MKLTGLSRKRKTATRYRTHQQHWTRRVVKHEASDMTNRFGSERWCATIYRARTDDDDIGIPCGGTVDDFALWTALTLQGFYSLYL